MLGKYNFTERWNSKYKVQKAKEVFSQRKESILNPERKSSVRNSDNSKNENRAILNSTSIGDYTKEVQANKSVR